MTFELCVPAYNEAPIIADALKRVQAVLEGVPGLTWRIVVADNASTDDTAGAATSLGEARVSVLRVEEKGKGAARSAAARAREDASACEAFGFIDADLSADPADIPALLTHLESGAADIIIGSRLLDTRAVKRGALRTFSSELFNALRRVLLGVSVKDSQCGLKLMNARGRAVLAACEETGWFFDMEFLARAEREGLVIREEAIRWDERRFPDRSSKLHPVLDGFAAVRAMFRIRAALAQDER